MIVAELSAGPKSCMFETAVARSDEVLPEAAVTFTVRFAIQMAPAATHEVRLHSCQDVGCGRRGEIANPYRWLAIPSPKCPAGFRRPRQAAPAGSHACCLCAARACGRS